MSTTIANDRSERVSSRRLGSRERGLNAALIGGSAIAAALAHAAATSVVPEAAAQARDPALDRLLLGMAFVKLAFVAAMVALAMWRFRRPLGTATAIGYLTCIWASTAATVLIWQSAWLGFASVLFHGAGFAFLVLALRDDRVLPAVLRRR